MPLVQIRINKAGDVTNNNSYISVPIFGVCNIKVMTVSYHSTDGAGVVKTIQIQSDKLILPASPLRFITLLNNAQTQHTYDQGVGYSFDRVELNGKILINVTDISSNTTPENFTDCLLTLQIDHV
jgi:hypothetical protein